jgi:hypothetical protein
MGKANRERRRSKEKARRRIGSTPPRSGTPFGASMFDGLPPSPPSLDERVSAAIGEALTRLSRDDRAGFVALAGRIADGGTRAGAGWRRSIDRALTEALRSAVAAAWRRGWQPADVVRFVGRELAGPHQYLSRAAIAAELGSYAAVTIDPQWSDQLTAIEATVWWPTEQTFVAACAEAHRGGWSDFVPMALELLSLMTRLPELERLGPLPGSADATARHAADRAARSVDERVLARVRALLAKAESTNFPAEAETFTSGAQALMARHSIDHAMLAATGRAAADSPGGRRIGIDNPYEAAKTSLLTAVASANRCRTVWSRYLGFSTVIGFPTDVDAVELLFTSLLVQATTAMTQAGKRTDHYGRSRTRGFRQAFLLSYAQRIGERLSQATASETEQAAAEPGSSNLLPILAARDDAVDEAVSAIFPHVTYRPMTRTVDREGWAAGRTAADLAALDVATPLPG